LRCQASNPVAVYAALSSTGFKLCTAFRPQLKPHRLKPVLLERAGPTRCYLAGLSSAYNCQQTGPNSPTMGTFASKSDVGWAASTSPATCPADKFCHMIPDSRIISLCAITALYQQWGHDRDNLRIGPCQPDYEAQPSSIPLSEPPLTRSIFG